jgi:hypothetical protein
MRSARRLDDAHGIALLWSPELALTDLPANGRPADASAGLGGHGSGTCGFSSG